MTFQNGLFGKGLGTKQPFSFSGNPSLSHHRPAHFATLGDMEVCLIEEQQSPSGSRTRKRSRMGEDQGDGPGVPTEKCTKHPSLYLEDGNVVLRCEE